MSLPLLPDPNVVRRLANIHPSEILQEEFLIPLGISTARLARVTGIPFTHAQQITRGERAITLDAAQRLAIYFHTSVMFWLNLQAAYDEEEQAKRDG